MEKMGMREELALTLLADAVAREVEATEHNSVPEELREEMRDRSVENVRDEAKRCGLDLEKFLPVQLIDKMADAFLKASGGKLTLADLYEEDEQAAHRFALGALGHGVRADDNTYMAEWLEEKGVNRDKLHLLHFEGPHEEAFRFMDAWIAAYGQVTESAVEASRLLTTMEKMEMREELALTLLADAVASEVGATEHNSVPEELREEMRDRIIRPQEDIVENVRDEAERCGLDLDDFLPVQLIDKMADAFLKASGGKLTLADLYEESEQAAHRFALGALGHGVNADDETEMAEWLELKGVDLSKLHRLNFEGPHDEAFRFMDAWIAAYGQVTESAVEAAGTEESDFISYLEETLIPDLKDSGLTGTADDFTSLALFLKREHPAAWEDLSDFVLYLEDTLIPDLKRSGSEATAEDFEAGLLLLQEQQSGHSNVTAGKPGDVVFVKDIQDLGIKSGDRFDVQTGDDPLTLMLYGENNDKTIEVPAEKLHKLEDDGFLLEARLVKASERGVTAEGYVMFEMPSVDEAQELEAYLLDHHQYFKLDSSEMYLEGAKIGFTAEAFNRPPNRTNLSNEISARAGKKISGAVTATGEPDQDYDQALFDSIVTALRLQGLDGYHREFDKYQGVYLDVSRDGRKLDRFWVSNVMEFKGPGGEIAREIFLHPESSADLEVPVVVLNDGSMYFADIEDLVQYLKTPRAPSNQLDAKVEERLPCKLCGASGDDNCECSYPDKRAAGWTPRGGWKEVQS